MDSGVLWPTRHRCCRPHPKSEEALGYRIDSRLKELLEGNWGRTRAVRGRWLKSSGTILRQELVVTVRDPLALKLTIEYESTSLDRRRAHPHISPGFSLSYPFTGHEPFFFDRLVFTLAKENNAIVFDNEISANVRNVHDNRLPLRQRKRGIFTLSSTRRSV